MADTTEPLPLDVVARQEIDRIDKLIDRLVDPWFDPTVIATYVEHLSNAKLKYLHFIADLTRSVPH